MALLDWMSDVAGPVVRGDGVLLRPPRAADHAAWSVLRDGSRDYLQPWEPAWPDDDLTKAAFRRRLSIYAREMELGNAWPFFVFIDEGRTLVGAVTLSNVRRGVAETGTLGYWIGRPFAGRGHTTAAVRGVVGFAFDRVKLHRLEADLRNAFVRGEIVPFFQPIVNLNTGAVAGFEALARWRHPRRGLVPPDEFLGLTADLGMMNELGLLMMTQSARQLAEWLERHPLAGRLFCSVNLSVGEIERPHLCEDVARVIKESGLPRGALKLEVTEGDIMRDTERAAEVLQSLKDVGASLALDDFGTGFSSLSYLARLPFDTLKIDRYFVLTMNKDEGSAKIVKSVVNLGRDLSLEVVAEGVENAELARLLLEAQCHYGQGFGYAPALPAQEAEVYLAESLADGSAPIKQRSA